MGFTATPWRYQVHRMEIKVNDETVGHIMPIDAERYTAAQRQGARWAYRTTDGKERSTIWPATALDAGDAMLMTRDEAIAWACGGAA